MPVAEPAAAGPVGSGRAGAGRAGRSGLAAMLGIAVHPVKLLRPVAALPGPEAVAAPQVLGIDDFALRKGRVRRSSLDRFCLKTCKLPSSRGSLGSTF